MVTAIPSGGSNLGAQLFIPERMGSRATDGQATPGSSTLGPIRSVHVVIIAATKGSGRGRRRKKARACKDFGRQHIATRARRHTVGTEITGASDPGNIAEAGTPAPLAHQERTYGASP